MADPITSNPALPIRQPSALPQPTANPDASAVAPSPLPLPSDSSSPSLPAAPAQAPQYTGWQTHGFGKVLSSVLGGNKTVYQPNPQNPNGPAVPTQVPMKPGEMFRHILGAGILGLAAGSGSNDMGGGFRQGFAAQQGQQNQQNEQVRKQAQQDWENQQKQKEDARQDSLLKMEQQKTDANLKVAKANLALSNINAYKAHLEIENMKQGQTSALADLYQKDIAASSAAGTMLQAAGVKPAMTVTDTEYAKKASENPAIASWYHRAVGMRYVQVTEKDENGNPQTVLKPEQLLEVYSPDSMKNLKVNKAFQDTMISTLGLQNDPIGQKQVRSIFKEGRELSPTDATNLFSQVQNSYNTGKAALEFNAKIAEYHAQAAHASAETAKVNWELKNAKDTQAATEALGLALSGADLQPEQEKLIRTKAPQVQLFLQKQVKEAGDALTAAAKSDDPEVKKAANEQYTEALRQSQIFSQKFGGPAKTKTPTPSVTPQQAVLELKANAPKTAEDPEKSFYAIAADSRINSDFSTMTETMKQAGAYVPEAELVKMADLALKKKQMPDGSAVPSYADKDDIRIAIGRMFVQRGVPIDVPYRLTEGGVGKGVRMKEYGMGKNQAPSQDKAEFIDLWPRMNLREGHEE